MDNKIVEQDLLSNQKINLCVCVENTTSIQQDGNNNINSVDQTHLSSNLNEANYQINNQDDDYCDDYCDNCEGEGCQLCCEDYISESENIADSHSYNEHCEDDNCEDDNCEDVNCEDVNCEDDNCDDVNCEDDNCDDVNCEDVYCDNCEGEGCQLCCEDYISESQSVDNTEDCNDTCNDDDYEYEEDRYNKRRMENDEYEQQFEENRLNYHTNKESGNWLIAKMIINQSYTDSQRTVFFNDYLDKLFIQNSDCFDNITNVYYIQNESLSTFFKFDRTEGKYIVENLKINEYKPNGLIYASDNKWSFKIIVITTKNIYCANRYINDELIGFY